MGADKTWHDKEEYLKQAKECRYCREEECDGIHITADNKTKCNKTKEE